MEASEGGQKKQKIDITFFSPCIGYGVCKMSARVWGVFLDISTERQNAYFFIYWGVLWSTMGHKRSKMTTNFCFFSVAIWVGLNDRTSVGSNFGYQEELSKCLMFLYLRRVLMS